MDKQPTALRLADELVFAGRFAHESEDQAARRRVNRNTEAAAELRRLHQANQELVEALSLMCDTFLDTEGSHGQCERNAIDKAQAILAKHKEQA